MDDVGARELVIFLGMAFGCLVAVNGALLIFRPDLFLKLYDLQNPRDYWGKTAEWRKNVHNTEYKVLGFILLVSGLLFLWLLAKVLTGTAVNV